MNVIKAKVPYPFLTDRVWDKLNYGDILETKDGELLIYTSSEEYVILSNGMCFERHLNSTPCRIVTRQFSIADNSLIKVTE